MRTVARVQAWTVAAAVVAATGPAGVPELVPVPTPVLTHLEEPDRRQLEEERAALDAVLEEGDPEPGALAEAFGSLGRLYLLYDLVDVAEPALVNAAALAPEEHPWHYYLGVLYQREGRWDEARERLGRAVEILPRDLPSHLRLAQVLLDSGRTEEAEREFRAVLEIDSGTAAAEVGLGRIAYDRGRVDEAIERLGRALALQPDADSIHHRLGLAYRQAGDLEKAREHLAKNRSEPVTFPDPLVDGLSAFLRGSAIHFKRGNRALEKGLVDLAIEQYRKAAEIAPDDPLIQYNLGLALTRAGRRSDAIERFRRAVALDPGYRDAHYNLATALAQADRWTEAAEHFERAWRIDPLDHSAHLDWASALARAGEDQRAVAELRELLAGLAGQERPEAGRAHFHLGALLASGGDGAAALRHLEAAAELLPEDPEVRRAYAGALARARRFDGAAAEYEAAARLDPGDVGSRFGQAMALVLAGRYGEARGVLESAVTEAPADRRLPLVHLLARLLATAPDPAVRDGGRAVELASRVFESAPGLEHAETLAMAYAEAGELEQAVAWQRQVVDRAESAGAPADVLALLRDRLESYRRGEPVRSPWEGS